MKSFKGFILAIIFIICSICVFSQNTQTAVYKITATSLNIRTAPSVKNGKIIGTFTYGATVEGEPVNAYWIKIRYNNSTAYVSTKYAVRIQQTTAKQDVKKPDSNLQALKEKAKIIVNKATDALKEFKPLLIIPALLIAFLLFKYFFTLLGYIWGIILAIYESIFEDTGFFTFVLSLLLLPFKILNRIQIILHKPWRIIQRYSWESDTGKKFLRTVNFAATIPFYIAGFPIRFVNAVAFNMILRPIAEFWNYLGEVVNPSSKYEGYNDFWRWILHLPKRIIKYLIYHGLLTIIECALYTILDTFYPAFTLYHGTSYDAAQAITVCPSRIEDSDFYKDWTDGVWNVGSGNYAGDGIYFAPRMKTSKHYAYSNSEPVIIICRVSFGLLLPLSLAPYEVYSKAGHANAHAVTEYGLREGYTTIEWWRKDTGWWEYCMLDWQNKYNESWRIRPIMVLDLESNFFRRIKGGSRHWLFDSLIITDIKRTLKI